MLFLVYGVVRYLTPERGGMFSGYFAQESFKPVIRLNTTLPPTP